MDRKVGEKQEKEIKMDLADGILLITAELTGIRTIVSIDRDFYVYRGGKNIRVRNKFDPLN